MNVLIKSAEDSITQNASLGEIQTLVDGTGAGMRISMGFYYEYDLTTFDIQHSISDMGEF